MARLLVVDDETNLLFSLEEGLRSEALELLTARTAREGIERVRQDRPDAVILDVRLPDRSGLDAFDEIRRIDPRLPVVVVTAFATTETAIEAMKRGAFEYLLKPLDLRQLREVLGKALEQSRLAHVPALLDDEAEPSDAVADRIVGRSPAMQEVYKAIGRVAAQDVTVLIRGESGTGKELVARALYQHGRRAERAFLAINCAAIPEALLESELFGHERGAFTGADRRRIGKFEQADGGTLFLDEVGDMAPTTQAKILRLLQDGRFERLGSNDPIRADVRVIAATNRDLEAMVADGRFRPDLYYRLKVFTISLPRLRDRREDLPILVEYLVKSLNRAMGKQVRAVAPEVMAVLTAHDWPGNVRELQAVLKSALVHAAGELLTADCLPAELRPGGNAARIALAGEEALDIVRLARELIRSGESGLYEKLIARVDRAVLSEVLRQTRGNQVRASELLGISRNTLRSKLRASGLAVEKQVGSDQDQDGQ
ncbi:MAG: sigma-54 dependent transcriptional regulator [Isosphaeraceae bacterium]